MDTLSADDRRELRSIWLKLWDERGKDDVTDLWFQAVMDFTRLKGYIVVLGPAAGLKEPRDVGYGESD